MTLADSPVGSTVRIDSLADFELKNRLMTMGLIPGTKVKVLRSALFDDPIAINLRSYNLALRRDDASRIEVTAV